MNAKHINNRQVHEIALAVFYETALGHGTDGHGRLVLMAQLAENCGDPYVVRGVRLGKAAANACIEEIAKMAKEEISD
jgi:hypothetical protein